MRRKGVRRWWSCLESSTDHLSPVTTPGNFLFFHFKYNLEWVLRTKDLAYDHTTLLKRHVFWTDCGTHLSSSQLSSQSRRAVSSRSALTTQWIPGHHGFNEILSPNIHFFKGRFTFDLHVQVLTLGNHHIKIHFLNLMAEWGDQVNQRFPLVKPQENHWCHPVLVRNASKDDPGNGCSLLSSVARAWVQSLSYISCSLSHLENSGHLENGDRDTSLVSTSVSQYKGYQSCVVT